ncbi:sugar phosphate permease [Paraburkholderia silvatlantica]|uniref:Lysosomal dipeptide transporter MFSD1 n=1 Tax=Paraburkholderia silvatlantica TaxID=321895 RepID=A0A2V4T351_9BURK|nr:MFS transporter [Paraburkholderia silvatlantica]PYE17839.1 sugar phosphate permease [Paraburkholderia silvatlantica]
MASVPSRSSPTLTARGPVHIGFVIAWLFCIIFYFVQYALRSAPGVMVPELSAAFGRDAVGVSALVGLYYYTYSLFSIIAGAALDRLGGKSVIPVGIVLVAIGAVLFGIGGVQTAGIGRLMQGAGSACAFTGAVYLATHGFPPRYLATAVGFTQCFGMLGGSAGQFAVGPIIHGLITWQQFWWLSGAGLFVIAMLVFLATPVGHDAGPASQGSWAKMFAPYRTVLTNPQSYLCGFCAGLLFLPTTIGDMIWGVPFLRNGLEVSYAEAVNRASMVPLGWVIGCPLLGYLSDHFGRRKPVLLAGALLMLASGAAILYLPPGVAPRYVLGLLLGVGSGAAMLPYSVIKEVNPDNVKGSATGAINFLVFTFSAWLTPVFGRLLTHYAAGGPISLPVFRQAGAWLLGGIVVAMLLALFLRETGPQARTTR